MFAVTNFCQAVSRRTSVRRLQDRSVNADRRRTLCRLNLVMAVKPKHHNFQVKIALNEEDMNKLVLCNILYAFISAALTCLVVLFIHIAICALTLRFVYLYRENEGMSSRDCLQLF